MRVEKFPLFRFSRLGLALLLGASAGLGCSSGTPESNAATEAPSDQPGTSSTPGKEPSNPAEALLWRSIEFHDPDLAWDTKPIRMEMESSRPGGLIRRVRLLFDNRKGLFESRTEQEGNVIEIRGQGDSLSFTLNGSDQASAEEMEKHRLTPSRMQFMRNYYAYLMGLPMKLRDPGTIIAPEPLETTFQDQPALALRVTYEEEVGADTWYFYFQPDTAALIGYRFYHDEAKNDGEYITLEEEAVFGRMRLPKVRLWYTHQDDRHLGTDSIVKLEVVSSPQ